MTTEELLQQIVQRLDLVLEKLDNITQRQDSLLQLVGRGWQFLQTPTGKEFGVFAGVTYGQLLLVGLGLIGLILMISRYLYDVLSPKGWW